MTTGGHGTDGVERRGLMFVLSSPSGAGKTTLSRLLIDRMPGLRMSVSATTRAMRPGEVDGRDYLFVDKARFGAMVKGDELLEWATVFDSLGLESIAAHEHDLLVYATNRLQEIEGLRIIGTAAEKAAVISFVLEGVHPHDIGTILDQEGVAIRTGHHCAQPLMMRFNVPATGRASFGLYNTREEADALVAALHKVIEVFR